LDLRTAWTVTEGCWRLGAINKEHCSR
jgi:hypothetical protein